MNLATKVAEYCCGLVNSEINEHTTQYNTITSHADYKELETDSRTRFRPRDNEMEVCEALHRIDGQLSF